MNKYEFIRSKPWKKNLAPGLVGVEGKLETTGRSYSQAINRLSEHYSSFTGKPTNIYSVDLENLMEIKKAYDSIGKFSEKGYESHGLYRVAIKDFYRYQISQPKVVPPLANLVGPSKPSFNRKISNQRLSFKGYGISM